MLHLNKYYMGTVNRTVTTTSPVNQEDTEAQNQRLIAYLSAGNTIHVMDRAKEILEIGYLNSRMSDIKKQLVAQGKALFQTVDLGR